MSNLRYEEFVDYAPDIIGPAVRINHDSPDCTGMSRSLSIWRNADDSIGAKCYRCGAGGKFSGGKPSMFKTAPKSRAEHFAIPADIEYRWDHFPPEVIVYLSERHFTEWHTSQHKIGWSAYDDRLIFPATNQTVKDPGWQGKSFDRAPRYLTRTLYPDYMYTHLLHEDGNPRLRKPTEDVLIVEDLLSAIRGRDILSSFALLGTELTDFMLAELKQYKRFLIWLDNDNAIVKKKQLAIYNRLSLYGDCYLIKKDHEVKERTQVQLRQELSHLRHGGIHS